MIHRRLTENQRRTITFLQNKLSDEKISVQEVKASARIEAISVKSLAFARQFLKVLITVGEDGRFYWQLPGNESVPNK